MVRDITGGSDGGRPLALLFQVPMAALLVASGRNKHWAKMERR